MLLSWVQRRDDLPMYFQICWLLHIQLHSVEILHYLFIFFCLFLTFASVVNVLFYLTIDINSTIDDNIDMVADFTFTGDRKVWGQELDPGQLPDLPFQFGRYLDLFKLVEDILLQASGSQNAVLIFKVI